ncbi:hypothetical protein [Amycolatopsis marina]|uniref:hypothetical protein n=1 Tax=Amycolatopsis marina TaxID=490629 RepID=UPI001FEB34E0|nr:hypothetical protein [Amycolatopsis marina]
MRFLRGLLGRGSRDEPVDPRTRWPEQSVPEDPGAAARLFWRSWFELLPQVSAALGDGEPQRVEHELCRAVAHVHPDLHFSLERGQRAIYALVVTGQEDPALRPFTDAWKAAAPAEDAMWEYHDSVPPVPDPAEVTVHLGETRVALAEVRIAAQVDSVEQVVDVAVHHPALAGLSGPARSAMTFLPLDATLGERLAAERLRRVETADLEPEGAISLLELRELVRGLGDAGT